MADNIFDQIHQETKSGNVFDEVHAENAKPEEPPSTWRSQLGEGASHFWNFLKSAADPRNGITGVMKALDQTGTELTAAKDAFKAGNYNRALYHTVRSVPVLGPLADQVQEEAASGHVGAALGDTAGLMVAGKAADIVPAAIEGARALPGKVAEIASQPGVRPLAAGAAEVAAAAPALYAGHPYVAGGAFLRGVQNIKKGLAARRATNEPVAPVQEPGATNPADVVPKEPQFEEMPPVPARREFVSPGGPPAPVGPQQSAVQTLEPQFEEMGPIPPRREFTPQPTSTQVVAQEAETLDAVAKSLAGKKFASLTPNQQVTARQLATKLKPVSVAATQSPANSIAEAQPAAQPTTPPNATDAAKALAAETGQEGTIPFSKPAYQKRDAAAGQPSVEPEGFKMLNRAERHSRAVELSRKLHEAGVTAESLGGIKTADLPSIGKQAGVEIPATDSARQALLDEALFELRKKQRAAPAAQALADAMQQ